MRRTFLADNGHDCGEELEVTVGREVEPMLIGGYWYRLVSWPSTCKCGRPIPLWEPTQDELKAAYDLTESEEV